MSEIQKYVQSNALGSLLTEDGTPDIRNIRRLNRSSMILSSNPYSEFNFMS